MVTLIILYLTQVSALRRVYGKISNFPKKHTAFHYWQNGDSFNQIAKKLGVAEATAEIYVIDMIAGRLGSKEEHSRLVTELEIPHAAFEEVEGKLTQSGITLRQIFEETSLGRYNEIRAIIAVMINGFKL